MMIVEPNNLKFEIEKNDDDKPNEMEQPETAGTTTVQDSDGSPEAIHAAMLKGLLPLADEMIDIANGTVKKFKSSNNFAITECWEFIKKIIVNAGHTQKINAENTQDVISLLKTGAISIEDATKLMSMLYTKTEIDDFRALADRVARMEGGQLSDNRDSGETYDQEKE